MCEAVIALMRVIHVVVSVYVEEPHQFAVVEYHPAVVECHYVQAAK